MSARRWLLHVCPHHGILSERELDDAPEMGTDYWGETCGPLGCPLSRRVPVPTTADRTRPQLKLGQQRGPLPRRSPWADPAWTDIECLTVLEEVYVDENEDPWGSYAP